MIIFAFPISRSIPTYYGLKWSHNSIFKFLEFVFYFFRFFFTCRVGTKWNDNFCFPSFSAFFNLFWIEMKPQWIFFIFLNFFLFFWNFPLRVRLARNMTIVFIFSRSQRFPPYFGLKWSHNSILQFFEFFCYLFGILYYALGWNETKR